MTYRGHIQNGIAVLDGPVNLPDGTPVRVEVDRIDADFWEGKSVEVHAREQGVKPCTDPHDLAGDWPAEESLDDFLALIRGSRVG
jgi:hypothetical protein